MKHRQTAKLIASILIPQVAGALGAIVTAPAISAWYAALDKPGFTPPGWLFGPAWTLLYLLMGIALYLVWREPRRDGPKKQALAAFAAQLVLNTAWSFIFFGLKAPGPALAEIIVLWVAIAATIVLFRRVSRPAALLMLPYIFWVTFATALNYEIWRFNG